MAGEQQNRDFDFGFEPGIDTFAQGGVPTATAAQDGPLEAQENLLEAEKPNVIFAIAMIIAAALIFALPYFF